MRKEDVMWIVQATYDDEIEKVRGKLLVIQCASERQCPRIIEGLDAKIYYKFVYFKVR